MIFNHVQRLTRDPRYRRARILFTPEYNLGGGSEAVRTATLAQRNFAAVTVYRGQRETRRGFNTGNDEKYEGSVLALKLMDRRGIFIDNDLRSTPEGEATVNEFHRQLRRLEDRKTMRNDVVVHHITGKWGDNGKRDDLAQDDLAILFVLSHFIYDQVTSGEARGLAKNTFG